jgi:hypothetical protein
VRADVVNLEASRKANEIRLVNQPTLPQRWTATAQQSLHQCDATNSHPIDATQIILGEQEMQM